MKDAMFIVKNLIKKVLEVQQDIYACLIDYTRVFDKARHEEMIRILRQLKCDDNDIQLLVNLHKTKWPAMRIKDQLSKWKLIRRVSDKDVRFHWTCFSCTVR